MTSHYDSLYGKLIERLGRSTVFDGTIPPHIEAYLCHGLEPCTRSEKQGDAPEGARFILNLGIRDEDKKRTLDLLSRQQQGHLTAEEKEELASYIEADNFLSILRAKALVALKRAGQKLQPDE